MSYEPAKLHIEGPFDQSDVSQGPDTDLYLGESATDSASTDTKAQDIPTFEDEDSLLAPIEGQREFRTTGIASGERLYGAGFGSNYQEALVNWLIRFESLVQSEMGAGYKLTDDIRGEVFDPIGDPPGVLLGNARWTYDVGEGVNAQWDLEGRIGEGMQGTSDRNNYISNEQSNAFSHSTDKIETTDGSISMNLGEVSTRRYERDVNLDVMDMVHQFDVPVVGLSRSGVKGVVMFDGRVTTRDVADLEQTSRQINDDLHGRQADLYDAFTGRIFTGTVKESNTVFEAGIPDIFEYRIEVKIGEVVAPN